MIKIDKEKTYESHGYKFKNFITLTYEEKLMILEWRNHDKVRSVMVNNDIISVHDHLRFIDSLKERRDCYYWLVIDPKDNNVGVLDIIHIDEKEDIGELGFYLNPSEIGSGFWFVIECDFFVFSTIKLGNNLVTVDINNKDVLMLNTYLGSKFEGVKEIDGRKYYYNNHSHGEYIINRYHEYNLKDYIAYIKSHKNIVSELKQHFQIL